MRKLVVFVVLGGAAYRFRRAVVHLLTTHTGTWVGAPKR